MGKIINLGKFKMLRNSEKGLREYEVKKEISKLGPGWRVCSFKELDYIFTIGYTLGIKSLVDFKEEDKLYRISNSRDTAFYVDSDGLLQPFYIPSEENTEDLLLDYVFVKDI
jgi:hypothetical protein